MKTDWIFGEGDYTLLQEFDPKKTDSNPPNNSNDVELIIEHPRSFGFVKGNDGEVDFSQLDMKIPADIMDKLAVAWLRTRGKKIVNNPCTVE